MLDLALALTWLYSAHCSYRLYREYWYREIPCTLAEWRNNSHLARGERRARCVMVLGPLALACLFLWKATYRPRSYPPMRFHE